MFTRVRFPLSSARGHLVILGHERLGPMTQSRSFATVGPYTWNKLPQFLRDLFSISSDQFRKHLKHLYLSVKTMTRVGSASY